MRYDYKLMNARCRSQRHSWQHVGERVVPFPGASVDAPDGTIILDEYRCTWCGEGESRERPQSWRPTEQENPDA